METSRLDPTSPEVKAPEPTSQPLPVTIAIRVNLRALVIPEADGGDSVIVPSLPGCVSAAESIADAHANAVEAAEGWLEVAHDQAKAEALRVARGE
jgi:predicted RNase H-like HicB family nuclease